MTVTGQHIKWGGDEDPDRVDVVWFHNGTENKGSFNWNVLQRVNEEDTNMTIEGA